MKKSNFPVANKEKAPMKTGPSPGNKSNVKGAKSAKNVNPGGTKKQGATAEEILRGTKS